MNIPLCPHFSSSILFESVSSVSQPAPAAKARHSRYTRVVYEETSKATTTPTEHCSDNAPTWHCCCCCCCGYELRSPEVSPIPTLLLLLLLLNFSVRLFDFFLSLWRRKKNVSIFNQPHILSPFSSPTLETFLYIIECHLRLHTAQSNLLTFGLQVFFFLNIVSRPIDSKMLTWWWEWRA